MSVLTVRIPELPAAPSITLADRIPVWQADDNITRYCDLAQLRTLMETGGSSSFTSVYAGASYIYIVPASEAGGTTASIPVIAGATFKLRREGYPLISQVYDTQGNPTIATGDVEFAILTSGGFQLMKAGDKLIEGQRFEIDLVTIPPQSGGLGTGSGSTNPSSNTSGFIIGKKSIVANYSFDPAHDCGLLLQVRAGTTAVTITLPSVDDTTVPSNLIIPIETIISNQVQTTIATQGGQMIYMNNTSYSSLFMGIAETLWLLRSDDGWYVINDFARSYTDMALPKASYKVGLNQLLCKGQLVNRADYPRLWEMVQSLGFSLVSETVWQTATATTVNGQAVTYPYRGCFSTGDGSVTFRLPDLMNMFLRGVLAESGADNERVYNHAGGYQKGMVEAHTHSVGAQASGNSGGGAITDGNNDGQPTSVNSGSYGGAETRPENVGMLWVINV
jgi:hypothetical protein